MGRASWTSWCSREEIAFLVEAIDELPSRCREIVVLRKLKGLSQAAIAGELGISEHTVEVQVMRGMKRCDEYLQRRGVRMLRGHESS